MPQDSTTIFYVSPAGDTVYLAPSDTAHAPKVGKLYMATPDTTYLLRTIPLKSVRTQVQEPTISSELAGKILLWTFVIVIFMCLIFPIILEKFKVSVTSRKAKALYEDKQNRYHEILLQYLPYYKSLSPILQKRFIKRTVIFMSSKKFEYIEIQEDELMPLLVSAAAVQLTFGLDNYLMDHFEHIYILHHDYHYGLNSVPFQGHVNNSGIYLSWNNFLRGYDNYSDGDNVGLHEMAHALAYVNFNVDDGGDDGFRYRFIRFSKTGRAYFNQIQSETHGGFLGSYAATRYEEFWAVCVENFFERPTSFRIQMPELYAAMCELLNQDVLAPSLLLSSPKYV